MGIFKKIKRCCACYSLVLVYCTIFATVSMVPNVQTQTLAQTIQGPNSSNISDNHQMCEYRLNGVAFSEEAYCNVSHLNEERGFNLQYATTSLKIYCYSALPSTLWDEMFYENWMGTGFIKAFRSIQIENCFLTSISGNAFKELSLLRTLIIHVTGDYNNIRSDLCNHTMSEKYLKETEASKTICFPSLLFPSGIFSGLKNLEHLTLNGLKWKNGIWQKVGGLKKLQNLSMQGNDISRIDGKSIVKLPQLKMLDISNNDIQIISSKSFPLTLNHLNLAQNKIKTVAKDAFEGLVRLQTLNLRVNQITEVYSPMFISLMNLKELNLADNVIRVVKENAFRGMRNIVEINLNSNKIEIIPYDTFGHLTYLQELHLSNNHIKAVPSDTFIPKGKVTLVDISYNNISTLEYSDNAGPLSPTLETLIMKNNNMNSTAGWLTHSAFPALKTLDISYNKLHERLINTAWPNSLEQVNVSKNNIVELRIIISEGLDAKTSLKQLDASNNQITTISIVNDSDLSGDGLISFYFGDNPFHCDCKMTWLQELITLKSSSTNSYAIRDSDKLHCQTLLRHEPGSMKNIDPENFLCESKVACPEMCKCYHNKVSRGVNILDCKENNITEISNEIPDDCTELDLSGNAIVTIEAGKLDRLSQIEELFMNSNQIAKVEAGAFRYLTDLKTLDIARNKLQSVETKMFEGLVRLEVLDLSKNEINHIKEESLKPMKALRQLNLRHNKLKTISESAFQFLSQIQSIKLAENPWSCECGYVERFTDFMINTSMHINDVTEVACEHYDKERGKTEEHILFVRKQEFCVDDPVVDKANDNLMIIVTCTVLSITVIGLIAFTLVFKHRKFLQIWCFVKFGWKCHRYNESNKNKEDRYYDAFVSYSGKDCDFVSQELVPRLEEARNGNKGYKLCVHDRDFPAGKPTAETIIDVINNSKRIIVVLSNNYLRSQWCKYEFEQAHDQLVREGSNRIILILLEDVDPGLIYIEIGNYIKTRTYLKYSDPKLWSKIQHAMPIAETSHCTGYRTEDNSSDTMEFLAMDYI